MNIRVSCLKSRVSFFMHTHHRSLAGRARDDRPKFCSAWVRTGQSRVFSSHFSISAKVYTKIHQKCEFHCNIKVLVELSVSCKIALFCCNSACLPKIPASLVYRTQIPHLGQIFFLPSSKVIKHRRGCVFIYVF